jgi:hypothetical protein
MNSLMATVSTSPAPSWVAPADQAGQAGHVGLGGRWCGEARCLRGVAWGIESWFDPEAGQVLWQDLDFFPVERDPFASPLILYVHPPRESKAIDLVGVSSATRLVRAARASGFSVASIEYRHPVGDDLNNDARLLDNDIAQARRWLHSQARQLGIDTGNVFLVDQSRGSLGLWTMLQQRQDLALRVNAAYSHQLRASSQGVEVARRFVVESDWLAFVDRMPPEHAYDGVVAFFQRHLR